MLHQFVASGFIVTPSRDKTLLIWHNKLQKWLQPGGHVDPGELPHEAALREVLEEVGLRPQLINAGVELAMPIVAEEAQMPNPYTMWREVIPARKLEPEHIHMDLIYLMEHEEVVPLVVSKREIKEVAWFTKQQVAELNTFESVRCMAQDLLE